MPYGSTRLGEVCDVLRGGNITRKNAVAGEVPVVAGGLSSPYSHSEANRPARTVTVSGSGANAGYVNFWNVPIFASDCSTVVPKDSEKLLPEFVYRFLQAQQSRIYRHLRRGAAQPHVYTKDLSELIITIPPIPEQERIVAILDETFSAIATAAANAEKSIANARELFVRERNYIFSEIETELTNRPLGEVCGFQNGFIFKSKLFKSDGIPVVRISSIQGDEITDNRPVFVDPSDYKADLSKYMVRPGDLLIAMSGATTGKIGFNRTTSSFLLNQRVGKFEPKAGLDVDFLFFFLSTKVDENLGMSAGAAQPNLSSRQIREILVPFPTIEVQRKVVVRLREIRSQIDQLELLCHEKLTNFADLQQSLLHKAFTGELTADPKAADRSLSEAGI
jgi:type I restriction enzyme, S subunit